MIKTNEIVKRINELGLTEFQKVRVLELIRDIHKEFLNDYRNVRKKMEEINKGGETKEEMICDCGNRFLIEVSDEKTSVVFCPNCMKVLTWYGEEDL
jgi:hypothetical protein